MGAIGFFSGDLSENIVAIVTAGVIMLFVGDRMVRTLPRCRNWGLRFAALAFVVIIVDRAFLQDEDFAQGLSLGAVSGLMGGLLTLGPAWILLSVFDFAAANFRSLTSSVGRLSSARQRKHEVLAAEKRKRKEQQEWERQAPERERRQMEDAKRREEENRQKSNEQKARTDARADCEMLYQLYAVDIAGRFPRASLDEWITKYMNDNLPAGDVEERAEQLRKVILHHREQVRPTPKFMSLVELTSWYQKQVEEIEAVPMDDRFKRKLVATLNIRREEYLQSMMTEN